ncbi:BLUF domain-containing protein [Mucilaginibacter robiniae]|uniref:BLUF domain-containing protein n=1 Tax=Mucilaginibacter robiniae TaxID=2728022 RepID=A0A7L5DX09_9SPHI|nr:BLUF domain-containing protein [Mucilaginibacter robiniae]QJD95630.1 BLUF domain-containing protein [Mucilaginibacter robiniae]
MYFYRIFISKAQHSLPQDELTQLLNQSKTLIEEQDITGVLACVQGAFGTHDETHFIQVLEGPKPAVDLISDTITHDGRYGALRVLSEAPVENRRFDNWHTAFECINLEEHKELKAFFQLDDDVLQSNEFQEANPLLDFLSSFEQ